MTLIQSFPPELLSQIFEILDFPYLAALVCRQWHDAATENSALWLTIGITERDIDRPNLLRRILARSKGRPLALGLRFPPLPDKRIDYYCMGLYSLLRFVVREHLSRCVSLSVHAPEVAWTTVLDAFAGEQFPLLRTLHVRNDDAVAQWEINFPLTIPPAPAFEDIPIDVPAPMPPKHLVFPLPPDHLLVDVILQGLSLGDAQLPNLDHLQITHHFPGMVVDGRLNPWLCAHAYGLSIETLCVPAVAYPTAQEIEAAPPAAVKHMTLSELRATPSGSDDPDAIDEHDCAPFFCSLDTSGLYTLFIDTFDLDGRIWDDFIGALFINEPKFPLVTALKLRQMDFAGMSSSHVAFFLHAFPALIQFVLVDCFDGAWQDVIEVLEMFPALCVELLELDVDDGIIIRNDPMAFREPMFYHELPL
ncbi:hypothetical protein FB451DRAFT_1237513 [Mycena latifolia]|nr:hypothetical protein FB451DRAFT_1237513 [Mycena latifolia]